MVTLDLFYSEEYLYAGTSRETTNKAKWVAESLVEDPIPGVRVVEPTLDVTVEMLERVHHPDYVRAIRCGDPIHLANRNGVCEWSPGFGRSRLASTAGVVEAAVRAWETGGVTGSMSSGLHHARLASGNGFCTFNGLVIAAAEIVRRGAERVLIVDFDAHGGGGTASLVDRHPQVSQIDVAVDSFDSYSSTARSRYWFTPGHAYLDAIETALSSVEDPKAFDLVIYNTGVDPHEDCPTGGAKGVSAEVLRSRDARVIDWAANMALPLAFVFAGGYVGGRMTKERLVGLHRQTIEVAAGSSEGGLEKCLTSCREKDPIGA
jgi:acetoin utilization deacetylase AcuC-like enzyme